IGNSALGAWNGKNSARTGLRTNIGPTNDAIIITASTTSETIVTGIRTNVRQGEFVASPLVRGRRSAEISAVADVDGRVDSFIWQPSRECFPSEAGDRSDRRECQ